MMILAAAAAAVTLAWSPTATDTPWVASPADDPRGAVVFLHGWSQGLAADDILAYVDDTPVVQQLNDAGWSVYAPFLDSDWGSGYAAVDMVLEQAAADGFPVDQVRLVGVSAGGATALNWAWRNPDRVATVHLITPVFDLAGLHEADTPDQWVGAPSITESLDATYPDFETSVEFDPARHVDELAPIGARIAVYGARDDEVIDWDGLNDWADEAGISVVASSDEGVNGGGHIYAMSKPAWALTSALWFNP